METWGKHGPFYLKINTNETPKKSEYILTEFLG